MRTNAAILLFVTPLAFPSPLTWGRLASSIMPKWASNPSFPSNNRSSLELVLSATAVFHFHMLINCTTSSFFSTRLAREEFTPSLADLFTSEAGAFIRHEEEVDEIDSGEDDSLEGYSSQSYPPESENFTPELQNITTEFHSDIIGPSGQDQTIYDLYNKDNIFPLVPSSEDSSSEYSNVSSADKVESTNSISTSELDELASSLTRAGEMVAAAMRGVRSLVMTALQVILATTWNSRC